MRAAVLAVVLMAVVGCGADEDVPPMPDILEPGEVVQKASLVVPGRYWVRWMCVDASCYGKGRQLDILDAREFAYPVSPCRGKYTGDGVTVLAIGDRQGGYFPACGTVDGDESEYAIMMAGKLEVYGRRGDAADAYGQAAVSMAGVEWWLTSGPSGARRLIFSAEIDGVPANFFLTRQ